MAGIGFELKKMFSKKGLLSIIKAYGYAGIVCIGPMLLGIILLLGIRVLAGLFGAGEEETELLNSMVTYTLLISLVLSNTFSLVTTRYTADQLYMEKKEHVLPSFWGSIGVMLVLGEIGYGIFLLSSGVAPIYQFFCLMLFGELIVVWTEINYLTAIKDYQGILITFAMSLLIAWIAGAVMLYFGVQIITALLFTVCIAYGLMSVLYYRLLIRYFPRGNVSAFCFLPWIEQYPQLVFLGLFLSFGIFGHLVIMWTSPIQKQVQGLFYGAPMYDIPALIAFLSILSTTINFVTSVEVNFYPKYRNYFSLFNDGGALMDIRQAEKEMKATLIQELTYTFTKQFFATIVFILAGTFLLPYLPLGMNEDMIGIYRVLCVGYAFYAVGNCVMLIQLYFSDNTGALISGTVFMVVSCGGTLIFRDYNIKYYGVGFLAGGIAFSLVALFLLDRYMKKLMYYVLCNQPIVAEVKRGKLTKLYERMEQRYEAKYPSQREAKREKKYQKGD